MARTNEIISKKDLQNFELPSILWGIDGDWVVNYIEEEKPFYPTDHCGVLRVKTKDLLPEYVSLALYKEGEFERFSRTNRASIDRVKAITIHAPSDIKEQQKILDKINNLKNDISNKKQLIKDIDAKVQSKFVEMFGLENIATTGKTDKYTMKLISQICNDYRGVVMSSAFISEHKGIYPVYSSQTSNDGIFGYINSYAFDGEYITWTTDGANAGTVFYRNGKFNCTNVCGVLKAKDNSINMVYLSRVLGMVAKLYVNHVGNDKLMNTAMKNILVPIPPKPLQDEFSNFVKEQDKLKLALEEEIRELEVQKEENINKYFD